MKNQIHTQASYTYYGNVKPLTTTQKPYKVVFTGNFYNGSYDGIEDVIFYEIETGYYMDITDFIFDFFPHECVGFIDDIEQKIIDNY